jgi:hypothetical protein
VRQINKKTLHEIHSQQNGDRPNAYRIESKNFQSGVIGMDQLKIPNGDEKVTVELTVKELLALAGQKFPLDRNVEISARRKLNMVLEDTYSLEPKTVH